MPLRALIVDDEPIARRTLEKLCVAQPDIAVVGQARHGAEAVEAINALRPDIVFLDIEMRDVGGFEVIERIGVEQMPLVIFVTAFDRYALRAFEVNAVDYLLKPFDEARFEVAVRRARERLAGGFTPALRQALSEGLRVAITSTMNQKSRAPLKRMAVDRNHRLVFLDTADIQCIEARGNYIVVHAGRDSYLMRATLQQTHEMLDPATFMRIHRSIVINRNHVREIERTAGGEYALTLANGQKYSSSASHRPAVVDYIKFNRPRS